MIPSHSKIIWADGKVVGDILTKLGDGNTITNSVFLLDGEKYIVHGSHNEVLYKSNPYYKGYFNLLTHKKGCGIIPHPFY